MLVSTGDDKNLWLNLQYLFSTSPHLPAQTLRVLTADSPAMLFDLTVLILSTIGLLLMPGRTSFWKFLFRDGIVYFVVAFSANLTVAVFLLLDLNPVMNVMFALPAACITASAASRAFIRLNTHLAPGAYVQCVPPPDADADTGAGADARAVQRPFDPLRTRGPPRGGRPRKPDGDLDPHLDERTRRDHETPQRSRNALRRLSRPRPEVSARAWIRLVIIYNVFISLDSATMSFARVRPLAGQEEECCAICVILASGKHSCCVYLRQPSS